MDEIKLTSDPRRVRGARIGSLTKLYKKITDLIERQAGPIDIFSIQQKLEDAFESYMYAHRTCVESYPDRSDDLEDSNRWQQQEYAAARERLIEYVNRRDMEAEKLIKDTVMVSSHLESDVIGLESQSDIGIDHVSSELRGDGQEKLAASAVRTVSAESVATGFQFLSDTRSARSKKTKSKTAYSKVTTASKASSARLAEARIQAKIEKTRLQRLQAIQEMERKKQDMERQKREMDNEIELERTRSRIAELDTEVHARELETVRSDLGSDYESSDDDEVTKPD